MSIRRVTLTDTERYFFQRAMERFRGRYTFPEEAEFAELLDGLIAFVPPEVGESFVREFWLKPSDYEPITLVALAEIASPGHSGDGAVARRWFDENQGYLSERRWDDMYAASKPRDGSVPELHDYRWDDDWLCPICGRHHHPWGAHPQE